MTDGQIRTQKLSAPTVEHASAVLRKHGFNSDSFVEVKGEGIANAVFLSRDLAVRINRDPEYEVDCYRERTFASLVRSSGAMAPKLLVFDDDRDIYPLPITVYARFPGVTALRAPLADSFFFALGRQMAGWHSLSVDETHPAFETLDKRPKSDALAELAKCFDQGLLGRDEVAQFERFFKSLEAAFGFTPSNCFLHNDLHLRNVLATEDGVRLTGVLDWSDCGWADPALEFHYLPASALPQTVAGYREGRPRFDPGLEGRVLHEGATRALLRLRHGDVDRIRILRSFLDSPPPGEWKAISSAWRRTISS